MYWGRRRNGSRESENPKAPLGRRAEKGRTAESSAALPCPGFLLASRCNFQAEERQGGGLREGSLQRGGGKRRGAGRGLGPGGVCEWPGEAGVGSRGEEVALSAWPSALASLVVSHPSPNLAGLCFVRGGSKAPWQRETAGLGIRSLLSPQDPPSRPPPPPQGETGGGTFCPGAPPRTWLPCSALGGFTSLSSPFLRLPKPPPGFPAPLRCPPTPVKGP